MQTPQSGSTDGPALNRLTSTLSALRSIQQICHVPSITFGVVHHGSVIYTGSIGQRNVEHGLSANPDTIYEIASCSKMFTSAALGILVDDGRLAWTDLIRQYVPGLNPAGDPRIGEEADVIDCLRHSSGLCDPSGLCLTPDGHVLVEEADVLPLLNVMSTSDVKGQKFNRKWDYNNFVYGLAALVVQKITGMRCAEFVRARVLRPLGLERTAMERAEVKGDDNVAVSYTTHEEGRFKRVPEGSWSCDGNAVLTAALGMRSSLNDMLKWCIAVMEAERREENTATEPDTHTNGAPSSSTTPKRIELMTNPLRQIKRVRRGYWTRPPDDPEYSNDAMYGMGWLLMDLPSSMIGSASGNAASRESPHQAHLQHILGKDSNPVHTISHTGGSAGSICSVFTFPKTQSAVVTMTNGRIMGDASDFAAQILIQALFDLRPAVDLVECAKLEAGLAAQKFDEVVERWEANWRPNDPMCDPKLYAGCYRGFQGHFQLDITFDTGPEDSGRELLVTLNRHPASKTALIFYGRHFYSMGRPSKTVMTNTQLSEYSQYLLEFRVNETTGDVTGLYWTWNDEEEAAWFARLT